MRKIAKAKTKTEAVKIVLTADPMPKRISIKKKLYKPRILEYELDGDSMVEVYLERRGLQYRLK